MLICLIWRIISIWKCISWTQSIFGAQKVWTWLLNRRANLIRFDMQAFQRGWASKSAPKRWLSWLKTWCPLRCSNKHRCFLFIFDFLKVKPQSFRLFHKFVILLVLNFDFRL
jgi:hypothetical protein